MCLLSIAERPDDARNLPTGVLMYNTRFINTAPVLPGHGKDQIKTYFLIFFSYKLFAESSSY